MNSYHSSSSVGCNWFFSICVNIAVHQQYNYVKQGEKKKVRKKEFLSPDEFKKKGKRKVMFDNLFAISLKDLQQDYTLIENNELNI